MLFFFLLPNPSSVVGLGLMKSLKFDLVLRDINEKDKSF